LPGDCTFGSTAVVPSGRRLALYSHMSGHTLRQDVELILVAVLIAVLMLLAPVT